MHLWLILLGPPKLREQQRDLLHGRDAILVPHAEPDLRRRRRPDATVRDGVPTRAAAQLRHEPTHAGVRPDSAFCVQFSVCTMCPLPTLRSILICFVIPQSISSQASCRPSCRSPSIRLPVSSFSCQRLPIHRHSDSDEGHWLRSLWTHDHTVQ